MKEFGGFPSRMDFTSVPNLFFSGVLPYIEDMAELKATLHVMAALYRKKGYPRYVSLGELLGIPELVESLKTDGKEPEDILREALGKAVQRGTFLALLDENEAPVYVLNDEPGRRLVEKVRNGEAEVRGLAVPPTPAAVREERPDIFTVYEQNIGILTPMIADELRDAAERYPEQWLRDAVKEAVLNNKRNIRYITRILETWSSEGRSDGTYQRHPEASDPDKYIKGKYGHMVRRR